MRNRRAKRWVGTVGSVSSAAVSQTAIREHSLPPPVCPFADRVRLFLRALCAHSLSSCGGGDAGAAGDEDAAAEAASPFACGEAGGGEAAAGGGVGLLISQEG